MKKIFLILVCALSLVGLTACGVGNTNTTYRSAQIGKRGSTSTGVIVSMEVVTVEGDAGSTVGTLAGAAGGAIAGSAVGGGRGSALMAIGGGVLGGVAGRAIGKYIDKDTAYEFLVQLDKTGDIQSVVQSNELELQPGDKVILVEMDGVTRIRGKFPTTVRR